MILITTKKGKYGKESISYNAYLGWQKETNRVEMLNAEEYVMLMNEATDNAGLPRFYDDQEVAFWQGKEGTDWQNEMLQTGFIQNHHLNFNTSTDRSNYSLSLGYLDQEGIYLNTGFERFNFRLNSEHRFGKRLKIGENVTYNHSIQNTGGDFYISRVFILQPTIPARTDDGWYGAGDPTNGESTLKNPVAMSELIKWENTQTHFYGTVYADYEIMEGLNFRSAFRLDRRITEKDYYEPSYTLGLISQAAFADVADFKDITWDWDNYLTFQRLINEKHNINATLGTWTRSHYNRFLLGKGFGFPSDLVHTIGSATTNLEIQGAWTEYKMLSYFGRFDYNYDNKYFLSGTLRRDGSSRFAPDSRWGTFPSVGLGWRVSEENFFKPIKPIFSEFKIRGSYGRLGNSAIGDYEYHSLVNFGLNYIFGAGQLIAPGGAPVFLANEDIKWETTEQIDLGIDLGFFSDKLLFKADLFLKNTYDILLNVPIPATSGASNAPRQNVGQVRNRGIDFELSYSEQIGKLDLSTGFNLSIVDNEIIDFDGISFTTGRFGTSHIYQEGYSLRSLYGYKTAGVFQNQEEIDAKPHVDGAEPGDLIFEDLSGPDGVPDEEIDAHDRTVLGPSIPNYLLGYNLNLSYRGFDVSVLMQGAFGHKIMLANANFGGGRSFFDFTENLVADRLNRWTGEGTSNTHPRLYFQGSPNDNNRNSDFFVEDGSYLRLKNLQIGYTFPSKWTKEIKVERLRIYAGGTNLWTQTNFSGFDPEIPMEQSDSFGWNYPMNKSFLIGLNLDF